MTSNCIRKVELHLLNPGQTLCIMAGGATYCVTATSQARNRRISDGDARVLRQGVSLVALDYKIELCAPSELCVSNRVAIGVPMEVGRFIAGGYVRIDETDPVDQIRYS